MSVIAHQTEKEWISANEKSRQRMSQTQAEGTAKQHAARLEEAHLRAHHSEQLKKINESFPNISIKTAGDYIKLFPKTEEEKGNFAYFLELDKNYQFYVTQPKVNKPLKVVLKGLPRVSLPEDIQIDLEALGYTIISCSQLISKRTKLELPFFLVTLPRNDKSTTIFDLTHLGYLQVRVEGYSRNGVTQCYKCTLPATLNAQNSQNLKKEPLL
ncbi:uncharacterized protein TNCV_352861 [Trichonephila clavipes]|nr:uncharacterized protein TNCV_352861 [Trichonephila clavipes]